MLKKWIRDASPNEKIIYYCGYGTSDTLISSEICNFVYKQAVAGAIYLVRQRCLEDRRLFEYIAIKASPTPVFRLIPLAADKLEERVNTKTGARHYVRKVTHSSEAIG